MNIFKKTLQKKIIASASSLLVLGFANSAAAQQSTTQSGFYVEPGITYEMGEHTVDWPLLSDSTGKTQGLGLLLRGGFHINETFFAGLDGRYSVPTFKDSSVNYDANSKSMNYGPFVGVQMPDYGLRLWGTYVMGGYLDPEASGSLDVKVEEPKGLRVGAGYHIQSFSVNLEYEDLTYGKSILEQAGSFTPGTTFDSVTLKNKTWILSATFPIEL